MHALPAQVSTRDGSARATTQPRKVCAVAKDGLCLARLCPSRSLWTCGSSAARCRRCCTSEALISNPSHCWSATSFSHPVHVTGLDARVLTGSRDMRGAEECCRSDRVAELRSPVQSGALCCRCAGRQSLQCVAMSRHYAVPILLIEFDTNKPFALLVCGCMHSRTDVSRARRGWATCRRRWTSRTSPPSWRCSPSRERVA